MLIEIWYNYDGLEYNKDKFDSFMVCFLLPMPSTYSSLKVRRTAKTNPLLFLCATRLRAVVLDFLAATATARVRWLLCLALLEGRVTLVAMWSDVLGIP